MPAVKHLYRGKNSRRREMAKFAAAYGRRGPGVYGAVVGKVARAQARKMGRKVERVRAHASRSRTGKPEWVGAHVAVLEPSPLWPKGAYVNKVKSGWVPAHWSHTKTGRRVRVKGHKIRAHKAIVKRD